MFDLIYSSSPSNRRQEDTGSKISISHAKISSPNPARHTVGPVRQAKNLKTSSLSPLKKATSMTGHHRLAAYSGYSKVSKSSVNLEASSSGQSAQSRKSSYGSSTGPPSVMTSQSRHYQAGRGIYPGAGAQSQHTEFRHGLFRKS